jgi:hypothetical protein
MPSGYTVVLVLKIAVALATLVLAGALAALARGNTRLHGRLNFVFFTLTAVVVLAFEAAIRLGPYLDPGWSVTAGWTRFQLAAMQVHLCFVVPLLIVLPLMLLSGIRRWRGLHLGLAVVFALLWLGMLVTGIGFLPHRP